MILNEEEPIIPNEPRPRHPGEASGAAVERRADGERPKLGSDDNDDTGGDYKLGRRLIEIITSNEVSWTFTEIQI